MSRKMVSRAALALAIGLIAALAAGRLGSGPPATHRATSGESAGAAVSSADSGEYGGPAFGPATTEADESAAEIPAAGPFADQIPTLRGARSDGDLSGESIQALIDALADQLETNPADGEHAVSLCQELTRAGALLGAEVVATAIGRVRNRAGLTGLIRMLDARAEFDLDARQVHRLVVALTQTGRGADREDGPEIYCRFSVLRGRVQEPEVRAFLERLIRSEGSGLDGSGGLGGALSTAVSALCSGTISDEEAERYIEIYEGHIGPRVQSYLLDGMTASASVAFRDWALDGLKSGSWASTEELTYKVRVATSTFVHGDEALAKIIDGSEEQARAVADALPSARTVSGSTRATARALLNAAMQPRYSEQTRAAAADAFVGFALWPEQGRPSIAAALQELVRNRTVPAGVRLRMFDAIRFVRPQDVEAVVSVLAAEEMDKELRAKAVSKLLTGTLFLAPEDRARARTALVAARLVPSD